MTQQPLPLRIPVDRELAVRAALASAVFCERFRVSLSRARCIEQQIAQPVRTVGGAVRKPAAGPPHCRSGQCRQGVGILLAAGVLERARCPTCEGCGWIPRERTALDVAATGGGP